MANEETQESHLSFVTKIKLINGFCSYKELSFKHKKILVFLYQLWSFVFVSIYLLNVVLLLIRVYTDINNFEVVAQSLSYAIMCAIGYISLRTIQSKKVEIFLKQLQSNEADHLKYSNSDIKKIYEKHARFNNFKCRELYYVSLVFIIAYSIFRSKLLTGEKGLLFFQWYPFSQDTYYWYILAEQVFYIISGLQFVLFTKLSMTSIETYITATINALHYLIEHLEQLAHHYQRTLGIPLDKARNLVISRIVSEHTNVIKYVNGVKENWNLFILLDFGLNSFQLGMILMAIFADLKNSISEQLILSYYFLINIHWIYTTYYQANEILVLSEGVARTIYLKTNWYNFDTDSKNMLLLVMLRSQKPLFLSIGPFGALSLSAFITVMKGTFSYMTFMKSIYLE